MSDFPMTETPYGFIWGPAKVERCISDPKFGVVVQIVTPRETWHIRVTPGGRVRLPKRKDIVP